MLCPALQTANPPADPYLRDLRRRDRLPVHRRDSNRLSDLLSVLLILYSVPLRLSLRSLFPSPRLRVRRLRADLRKTVLLLRSPMGRRKRKPLSQKQERK